MLDQIEEALDQKHLKLERLENAIEFRSGKFGAIIKIHYDTASNTCTIESQEKQLAINAILSTIGLFGVLGVFDYLQRIVGLISVSALAFSSFVFLSGWRATHSSLSSVKEKLEVLGVNIQRRT